MRQFRCVCGARLFFDNHRCLTCGRDVGFDSDRCELIALDTAPSGAFLDAADLAGDRADQALVSEPPLPDPEATPVQSAQRRYHRCANRPRSGCPWLVDEAGPHALCVACRLNRTIPTLSVADDRDAWRRVEAAKRRWVYGLLRLGLPIISGHDDADRGMILDVMRPTADQPVMTGHASGVITLNLNEADPVEREMVKQQMRERYRTLLGHLRHESGHHYWNLLVESGLLDVDGAAPGEPTTLLATYRACFGDERADYAKALEKHYAEGPPYGYRRRFVSSYASSHPWEDWAETWAHYLHLFDGLESARSLGLIEVPILDDDVLAVGYEEEVFDKLYESWTELSVAMNAMNRSLGLRDAYPFVLSETVKLKLAFVHRVIVTAQKAAPEIFRSPPPPPPPAPSDPPPRSRPPEGGIPATGPLSAAPRRCRLAS